MGKLALITGGNSGIGLATAKQFVNEGAHVLITGRREPELAAAVREIGRHVTGVQSEVSNLADLDRLFARIKREKGTLDIVLANAGVAKYAPFGRITRIRNRNQESGGGYESDQGVAKQSACPRGLQYAVQQERLCGR